MDQSLPIAPRVSVLTLVRGRRVQFDNLIKALAGQIMPPDEVVVAYMQDEAYPLPKNLPFEVRVTFCDEEPMPLAAARNQAAGMATGDLLIFLDVDCVPSPSLVLAYAMELEAVDGCLMGEVLYLPPGAADGADANRLDALGERHPSKPAPPEAGLAEERDYGELWGLSFALRRATFERCGGLDERFTGYGGEETDFARTLERCGVPLFRVGGARAYHQHHEVYRPPLHRFDDIIRNADLFRQKWGDWPMDYWLGQMEAEGYIRREDRIEILRRPAAEEIEAAKASPGTLYS